MDYKIAFNGHGNSILWAWQLHSVVWSSEVQISDFLLYMYIVATRKGACSRILSDQIMERFPCM